MSRTKLITPAFCALATAFVSAPAFAATYDVLWWDSMQTWGGQAPDALREEMSLYLDNFEGEDNFDSTYVSSEEPGNLSGQLSASDYDVIIFDSTDVTLNFNDDDLDAVRNFYSGGKSNLMFDGNLYVRNLNFNEASDFPGPNGAMGGYTVNQAAAIGAAGGGIIVGTDHDCCQLNANQIVQALLPGASFSGNTSPSTDGVFNGDLLLGGPQAIAAADVLSHWSSIPSQGIAPSGMFTDFLGNEVTLNSLVDVADTIGGVRNSFVSTSLSVGGGTTEVDDDTIGGVGGDEPGDVVSPVPLPASAILLLSGLGIMGGISRRRRHGARSAL